jgi:sulfur-oxidizing protein SoxA
MRHSAIIVLAVLVAGVAAAVAGEAETIRSATEFLSAELRKEQMDETQNRGMVWVDQGATIWEVKAGAAAKSCAECHGAPASLHGVAARYPAIDQRSGRLFNIEGRINECRTKHQEAAPFSYESEPLLALTALIAYQSRGMPVAVDVEGPARSHFEAGRTFFEERQGQLNIACSECHVANVGRKLRGDTISSGVGLGYPAYRLEWQSLGSLHRRLKACQMGVRAEEFAPGSTQHLALELYLAWRARGLPLEAPGIRR